jgi:predicted metalloprotease
MEGARMQQWNKEPRRKKATSEEGEDIRQDLQEDCRAGVQKANSRVFDQ